MSDHYCLYSLAVCSPLELPAPLCEHRETSVVVSFEDGPFVDHCLPEKLSYSDVNREEGIYCSKNVATFRIDRGERILITAAPQIPNTYVAATLVGAPMGMLFMQRGFLVMHAAVVELQGKVILFLAESGGGKSSLALSILAADGRLISDDLAVIEHIGNAAPIVLPAFPSMKVDSVVAESFGLDLTKLREMLPGAHKKWHQVKEEQFCSSSLPVDMLVIPTWSNGDIRLEKLSAGDAFIQILPHVYGPAPRTKYVKEARDTFFQTAHIVETTPCYRLARPHDLGRMSEVASLFTQAC